MTIKPVTMYAAECDLCGYRDDDGAYLAWVTADQASDVAAESEWDVEGGNHLCPDCIPPSPDDDAEATR